MPSVISVNRDGAHNFSKTAQSSIQIIEGLGVEGDAHFGARVMHPYLAKKNPDQPNLRQVHLFHAELIQELNAQGFSLVPGSIGENITTEGLDILALPTDTVLQIGPMAEIKLTGVRTPCHQLDDHQKGLTSAMIDKDENGSPVFKAGVMAIATKSGEVRTGDEIRIQLPPEPHLKLQPL